MARAASALLTGLCLLLLAAVLAWWGRSYFVLDEVTRVDARGGTQAAVSFRGAVHLIWAGTSAPPRPVAWDRYAFGSEAELSATYEWPYLEWNLLGFMRVRDGGLGVRAGPFLSDPGSGLTPWLA